jgi:hypothetical protein
VQAEYIQLVELKTRFDLFFYFLNWSARIVASASVALNHNNCFRCTFWARSFCCAKRIDIGIVHEH